jgi:hypothetical protein
LLRAAALARRGLGAGHASYVRALSDLAQFYASRGKDALAARLLRLSLVVGARVLGPDHPDLAAHLGRLAFMCDSQAEALYRQSLVRLTKALGHDHPGLAPALEDYALLLREVRRDAEAAALEARAEALRGRAAPAHRHA